LHNDIFNSNCVFYFICYNKIASICDSTLIGLDNLHYIWNKISVSCEHKIESIRIVKKDS